jgi:hypothetical protein
LQDQKQRPSAEVNVAEKASTNRYCYNRTTPRHPLSFYVENTMKRLPRFRPDRRVDALLVLGQSVFRDIGCASFNIYDKAGNVIQTHEHAGDFREPQRCVKTKASASGTYCGSG